MRIRISSPLRVALLAAGATAFLPTSHAAGVAESTSELTTPTLGTDSSYDLSSSTTGSIFVNKYLYDPTAGEYTAYRYRVNFTEALGDGGSSTAYYWSQNTNRIWELRESTQPWNNKDIYVSSSRETRLEFSSSTDVNESFFGISHEITGSVEGIGGALEWQSSSGANISGDFVGNSNINKGLSFVQVAGGAIYNAEAQGDEIARVIGDITGNFIANYAQSSGSSSVYGGAISNASSSTIGNIKGDFVRNVVRSDFVSYFSYSTVYGGAINNNGKMLNITGDFIENSALTSSAMGSQGGAIYNQGNIGNITGDFIGNAAATGNNSFGAHGGAISNTGVIGILSGDFMGNSVTSNTAQGGAIYNYNNSTETIARITGSFIGNFASTTSTSSSSAKGGAVFNTNILSFVASEKDILFTGNYIEYGSSQTKIFNAIYSNGDSINGTSLYFNAYNGNNIIVNDTINGESGFRAKQLIEINNDLDANKKNIEGDAESTVYFNNNVSNHTISVKAGELVLGAFAGTTIKKNDGSDLIVGSSSAFLSNCELDILRNAEVEAHNASAFGTGNNTINNRGTIYIKDTEGVSGTLNNSMAQSGGTLDVSGAMTLAEGRILSVTDSNNIIKGSNDNSQLSGHGYTLATSGSLIVQDIKLTNITITNNSGTLNLDRTTLVYTRVTQPETLGAGTTVDPINYILSDVNVNDSTITDALTMNITMTAEQFGIFNEEVTADKYILFTLAGVTRAQIAEGAKIDFSVNGTAYNVEYVEASANADMQFSLAEDIIPEPSTATLSLLALAGLLARRRRKQG